MIAGCRNVIVVHNFRQFSRLYKYTYIYRTLVKLCGCRLIYMHCEVTLTMPYAAIAFRQNDVKITASTPTHVR